ncbi:MAG: response regulator [Pseudomonadota bacterium]|nr:response regulator [Pseudomonadota bacterium]
MSLLSHHKPRSSYEAMASHLRHSFDIGNLEVGQMVASAGRRVVLIEDDPTFRNALANELCARGGTDIVFQTGDEAHAREWLAVNDQWDVCLLDIFLQRGTGIALLSLLRKRRPDQTIYILSNYLSPMSKKVAAQLGAARVFDKVTEVEQVIDACLGQPVPID